MAILEKGWLGGGNTGRNTTIIRSNYLQDPSAAIYEKARSLPATLQSEALQFVAYLASRLDAASEAVKWQQLMRETQAFVAARGITDGDIADEVAAVRAGR